jgi:hypothetical protein
MINHVPDDLLDALRVSNIHRDAADRIGEAALRSASDDGDRMTARAEPQR